MHYYSWRFKGKWFLTYCRIWKSTQFSVQEMTLQNMCNVIRFQGRQKQRKHVQGNNIQDALSSSTYLYLIKRYYLNKSLCLKLDLL